MDLHSNENEFVCFLCPKVFQTKKNFIDHYAYHKRMERHCELCDFKTYKLVELKRHMSNVHKRQYKKIPVKKSAKTFNCRFCNETFNKQIKLTTHILESHKDETEFPCDDCSKVYPSQLKLLSHQYRVHKNATKILCEICSVSFTTKGAYNTHMRQHTKNYKTKCEECGTGFVTYLDYERHCIKKHGLTKYVCHICGKNLSDAHWLRMHIARHAVKEDKEKATVKCTDCDKMFLNKSLMLEHHRNVHRNKICRKKWGICTICGKRFTQWTLNKHMKVHEKRDNKVFTCTYCGEIFVYELTLKRHLTESHPETVPFKCDRCGRGCKSLEALKLHSLAMHKIDGERNEDDPLSCIVCNEKFASTDFLLHHQIQKHTANFREKKTDYQKLKCHFCFKIFSNSDFLSKHCSAHEKSKTHLCDLCQSQFDTLEEFRLHNEGHTRERQFACFYCEKCFNRSGTLHMHERTHTGEKPYICSYCGRAFNQRASVRTHMKSHTGEIRPKREVL